MPLILTVLGLAGSLAANLYLGASYLDARQKYQWLMRKTADTFRRVKVPQRNAPPPTIPYRRWWISGSGSQPVVEFSSW